MKWLDICFKMAVSANWAIPGLTISRLETKKKLPDGGNSIMEWNKFRNAMTVLVFFVTIYDLSAVSVSTISDVSVLLHSEAIL